MDDSSIVLSPVRPRDAASLVIHRRSGGHDEVLMGRRGQKARFKPGVYVFPGGGLERMDYLARPLRPLSPELIARLAVGGSAAKAGALAMAAVREAYEECGLLFGERGDIGSAPGESWQAFRTLGMAPDLSVLSFLGRAITPSYRPIRFHARFFCVPYERMQGAIGGSGELEDLRWVRPDQRAGIEMPSVQESILDVLQRRLQGEHAPAMRLFYGWGRHNLLDA